MVVRVKDRFKHPSGGGWRDVMINFYVVGDGAKHVCEVQLVHKSLLTARRGLPGHVIYGVVRNATEVLEFLGLLLKLDRAGEGTAPTMCIKTRFFKIFQVFMH